MNLSSTGRSSRLHDCMRIWNTDPTGIEFATGVGLALIGLWFPLSNAFSTFFSLPQLAGTEWPIAAVLVPWGCAHAWLAHSCHFKWRSFNSLVAAMLFTFLALMIGQYRGWDTLGTWLLPYIAFLQAQCYINIKGIC